ncbi:accessory factor UbiK family protein [Nitrosomonadales bacterium]|nr:accessory factor UbiK family protein [Nitrosomonadales bacterium]
MFKKDEIQNLSNKIKTLVKDSPISDMEDNINALLKSTFTKMDLINREEYDVQIEVLKKTRAKVEALETKIKDIEKKLK